MITAAALAGWSKEAMPQGLPLPVIPEELTEPAERADYLLAHFWDGFRSRVIEEGELAEFLSVFPHATEEGRKLGAGKLVAIVDAQGEESMLRMEELIEGYLLDRRSPVRSDAAYVAFADAMVKAGWPGKAVAEYLRDMALRCQVGSAAPDFRFVTSEGEVSLGETANGKRTLLLFYDPDCRECRELAGRMLAAVKIGESCGSGMLQVLAVRIPEDGEMGDGSVDSVCASSTGVFATVDGEMPHGWISGCAIQDPGESLYAIPGLPALYLISADGTVELKDASLDEVLSVI